MYVSDWNSSSSLFVCDAKNHVLKTSFTSLPSLSLLLFPSVSVFFFPTPVLVLSLSPQPLTWRTTSAHRPCPVLLLAHFSWWQPCWWLTGSCPCSWAASFTSSTQCLAVSSGWPAWPFLPSPACTFCRNSRATRRKRCCRCASSWPCTSWRGRWEHTGGKGAELELWRRRSTTSTPRSASLTSAWAEWLKT